MNKCSTLLDLWNRSQTAVNNQEWTNAEQCLDDARILCPDHEVLNETYRMVHDKKKEAEVRRRDRTCDFRMKERISRIRIEGELRSVE